MGATSEGGSDSTGVVFSVGRLQAAPSYCTPCLFYGGDFDPSSPAADTFANENIYPGGSQTLSQIYSPFTVPAGQKWNVTGLFINTIAYPTALDPVATPWEIRSKIPKAGGSGGTLVASGTANATMTATGRSLNGVPEYTILVTWSTPVVLPAGTYWENVTPQCTDLNNTQCDGAGLHRISGIRHGDHVRPECVGTAGTVAGFVLELAGFRSVVGEHISGTSATGRTRRRRLLCGSDWQELDLSIHRKTTVSKPVNEQ